MALTDQVFAELLLVGLSSLLFLITALIRMLLSWCDFILACLLRSTAANWMLWSLFWPHPNIQTLFPLTYSFLSVVFPLLWPSRFSRFSLCQLNIIIANHPPAASYIMHYLLQLGLFLGLLKRRKSTPRRDSKQKAQYSLSVQFVGKSDAFSVMLASEHLW